MSFVQKGPHTYNGRTTSNLITHLQKIHPSSVKADKGDDESLLPGKGKQLSIKQFGKALHGKPCSINTQTNNWNPHQVGLDGYETNFHSARSRVKGAVRLC